MRDMIKKYQDCVNNFYINKDKETLIMSFDKVTSNEYYYIGGLKSIKIFIFICRRFSVIVF